MRVRATISLLVFVTSALLACRRPSAKHNEAGQAELHAAHKVVDENTARLAEVRREQLALRARLEERIAILDKLVARSKSPATTKALLERRGRLEEDLTTLDRADERGWYELKTTIESHLQVESSRDRT